MANNTNWLNISSQSGSSGQTILTLSANKNLSTNYKTAEITAYNPVYNISAKTYVTLESYAPFLSISPDLFGVPDSGGTYELTINANCAWVIAFPDLVTSYSTSAGTGNAVITFTVPGTTADTTLVGNIVVTDESGQISKIAKIEQYGSGVHIGVFPVELYFDSTGGSQTFSVSADAAYNVSVASGTNWAFVEPNSGYTGQTVFTVRVNSGYTGTTDRQGVINIDAPGQDLAVILYQRKPETRLVTVYNVTSTTDPTTILGDTSFFSKAELANGTEITLGTGYTFPSTGNQKVYYTLTGNTVGGFENSTALTQVVIPEGVTEIVDSAFANCTNLTYIKIPDTVTQVGVSAFSHCNSLSSITLPDSLERMESAVFSGCTSLSSITIPSAVTSIGSNCFSGSSVSSITFTSLTPPTLGDANALTSNTLSEIIVPCPAVNDYITAYPQYAQYISCSETGTTLYFTTDTSNVAGTGETRTITILNTNINPNRTGLNLPSDFPQQGSYVVEGNVIYLTYPRNPSSSATRNWTIGVVAQTKDGVSLSGSYTITQNANDIYEIPYTADTSAVDASGETRTITIDTSNLVASSITIGIEGATGVTYTYENGVITINFPETDGSSKIIEVTISAETIGGKTATSVITYKQVTSSEYFTFEVISTTGINANIKFLTEKLTITGSYEQTIQYRKNGGEWKRLTSVIPAVGVSQSSATIYVSVGDVIEFKGDYKTYFKPDYAYNYFCSNGARVDVRGNIMSLINSTGFSTDTTIEEPYAFCNLFRDSTENGFRLSIRDASGLLLPATNLTTGCYMAMFKNCTGLLSAPKLPATTLAPSCYEDMFENCEFLTTAPELPATTLAEVCYSYMFWGCTSLTTAPELPATALAYRCYEYMFWGCSSLNYIKCLATDISATGCTTGWVKNVASSGTFVGYGAANWTIGVDGIPNSWLFEDLQIPYTADTSTVAANGEVRTITIDTTDLVASSITISIEGATGVTYDYGNGVITVTFPENKSATRNITVSVDAETTDGKKVKADVTFTQKGRDLLTSPLTFIITSSGTIYWKTNASDFKRTIQYKKNNEEWTSITSNTGDSAPSISVSAGDVVQFRGDNTTYGTNTSRQCSFNGSTAKFELEGNIMSLIDSNNFATVTTLAISYTFYGLFTNCTGLTSAENLVLPATTLAGSCYYYMFYNCTSLTQAPKLPATTLSMSCYNSMFYGCTSLTQAPELPATTLAGSCYYYMFHNCTSLTQAPKLPATTLADSCYRAMFSHCDSLTTAPELPAIILANYCYQNMFSYCTSLTEVPELPAISLADYCYGEMFANCTSLTTTPELPATALSSKCYMYMFQGCTSLTQAPELPATTLVDYCYQYMFSGCTSLTQVPSILPAETLTESCYESMFEGCTSLTTAPELPARTLTDRCYGRMFWGCSSLNYIKCLATDISAYAVTGGWVNGVSSTGTFVTPSSTNWETGVSGIPTGWTRVNSDT